MLGRRRPPSSIPQVLLHAHASRTVHIYLGPLPESRFAPEPDLPRVSSTSHTTDSSTHYRCRAPHCQTRRWLLNFMQRERVLFVSQLAGTRHAEPRDRYSSVP